MTTAATRSTDPAAVRLGRRGRRIALSVHVIASGGWLGVDVALVVLVATAALTADPYLAGLCLRVIPTLLWPLAIAGLGSLLTGLLLGLGTRYGLLRWWWVAVKLAITVVYLVLIPVGLTPTALDRARLGQALLDRQTTTVDIGQLAYPAVVGPVLLVVATVLAVVQPWGRTRSAAR